MGSPESRPVAEVKRFFFKGQMPTELRENGFCGWPYEVLLKYQFKHRSLTYDFFCECFWGRGVMRILQWMEPEMKQLSIATSSEVPDYK